jgi:hypothetical protein
MVLCAHNGVTGSETTQRAAAAALQVSNHRDGWSILAMHFGGVDQLSKLLRQRRAFDLIDPVTLCLQLPFDISDRCHGSGFCQLEGAGDGREAIIHGAKHSTKGDNSRIRLKFGIQLAPRIRTIVIPTIARRRRTRRSCETMALATQRYLSRAFGQFIFGYVTDFL